MTGSIETRSLRRINLVGFRGNDEAAESWHYEVPAAGKASPEGKGGVQGPKEDQDINIYEPATAKKNGSNLGGRVIYFVPTHFIRSPI